MAGDLPIDGLHLFRCGRMIDVSDLGAPGMT
jgi:hypothetical protein